MAFLDKSPNQDSAGEPVKSHVIWKRPDGYIGSKPEHFEALELRNCSVWIHKNEPNKYPFQVSGGWKRVEATELINQLTGLLAQGLDKWLDALSSLYSDRIEDGPEEFHNELVQWIKSLKKNIKGDSWEVEIVSDVFENMTEKLAEVKSDFLKKFPKAT